jgi:hypothetical protein
MADDFDNQLGRMFARAPVFADYETFAARVTTRLDRAWAMRRTMIGLGGVAAGVVVAAQFLVGRFSGELPSVSSQAREAVDAGLSRTMAGVDQLLSLPAGNETLWFVAALAAAALALGVTRVVESY